MRSLQFSVRQVIGIIAVTLSGVLVSVGIQIPLFFGFLPGYLLLTAVILLKGARPEEVLNRSWEGLKKTRGVIYILLMVSFLLPSWYISGVIDQLVSISLHLITADHFFVSAFFIALIFSMILGTSVGTLSAVGIPIMSSAAALGLPVSITAGALISGAFVGDRTSPFSSSHQLLSHTVEVRTGIQFRRFLPTTLAAILVCMAFYMVLDAGKHSGMTVFSNNVFQWSGLSILKFLPPFILILFVILRLKIIYAFISSVIAAIIISISQGVGILSVSHSLWFGAEGVGGGLSSMYFLLLFLALAGAFNGLLEGYRVIQPLLDHWLSQTTGLINDSIKTIAATFIISLISANQTLPIILTGRSFLKHWNEKYDKAELARVMGDSTMLFPGMIPWSVLAIMCSTIVGVPIISYLPYAVFLWVLPLLTIILSFYKHNRFKMMQNGDASTTH